jgi:hypothetical protein
MSYQARTRRLARRTAARAVTFKKLDRRMRAVERVVDRIVGVKP